MNSDEYTPDDAVVRAQYIDGRAWVCAISETRLVLEFDRWLAAHDAEIRAERVAPESDWRFTHAEMTEHNALIWADGVTAMARGSELRMNASDVKKGNPYHVPPTVGATMTDELADRLDSLADETTRAADALLMREAAATIRAELYQNSYQKEQTDEQ